MKWFVFRNRKDKTKFAQFDIGYPYPVNLIHAKFFEDKDEADFFNNFPNDWDIVEMDVILGE